MSKSSTKGRVSFKPAIAEINQCAARRNIEIKIECIVEICKEASYSRPSVAGGDTELAEVLASLPGSLRRFNLWSSAALPSGWRNKATAFLSNAPQTLRCDKVLTRRVLEALDAVVEAKRLVAPSQAKAARLSNLVTEARQANRLRVIAEEALVDLKRSIEELRCELVTKDNEIASLKRESRREIERLHHALNRIRDAEPQEASKVVKLRRPMGAKEVR